MPVPTVCDATDVYNLYKAKECFNIVSERSLLMLYETCQKVINWFTCGESCCGHF